MMYLNCEKSVIENWGAYNFMQNNVLPCYKKFQVTRQIKANTVTVFKI